MRNHGHGDSGTHQRVKVRAIFKRVCQRDRVQRVSDEFVYAAFVRQHLALVEWDTESIPTERGGFQECDDERVQRRQFLFPYFHLLRCRRDIANLFCILGHPGESKDDLSETESQATVAIRVKGFRECLDVPDLVGNGREERGDLSIQ